MGTAGFSLVEMKVASGKRHFRDSPHQDRYRCAGGKSATIGAMELQLPALLLGMNDLDPEKQDKPAEWAALKVRFIHCFHARAAVPTA